jgi:hypothetical protein
MSHTQTSQSNLGAVVTPIAKVSRSDRWMVFYRLQELNIPCWCAEDGLLWVEIHCSDQAILLRSVIQQFMAPRHELVDWLEYCWDSNILQPRANSLR